MRGEVDFAASLRSRVQALTGVGTDSFERVRSRIRPTIGVRELTAAIHERGGIVGVVSGGFHEILDRVAPELGVDRWRANRLAVRDSVLTGTVDGQIVDAGVKATSLIEWADELGIPRQATIAVGDGANDLEMMAAAGLGLAFNAKPAVRASANLVIAPRDLRAIIPLLP
jgi:phosphoserine phosphatase